MKRVTTTSFNDWLPKPALFCRCKRSSKHHYWSLLIFKLIYLRKSSKPCWDSAKALRSIVTVKHNEMSSMKNSRMSKNRYINNDAYIWWNYWRIWWIEYVLSHVQTLLLSMFVQDNNGVLIRMYHWISRLHWIILLRQRNTSQAVREAAPSIGKQLKRTDHELTWHVINSKSNERQQQVQRKIFSSVVRLKRQSFLFNISHEFFTCPMIDRIFESNHILRTIQGYNDILTVFNNELNSKPRFYLF
jgi:hypothetical protein